MTKPQQLPPPEPLPPKPPAGSKTIIVQTLVIVASVITVLVANETIQENATLVAILGGIVLPVINIFIRFLTDRPIGARRR